MIKYILCDMDGTLLNEQKELSAKLFPLLKILKEKGIVFGAASGRQYYNLYDQFGPYAKDMIFIAENGSMMFEKEHCIYQSELPYEDLISPIKRMRMGTNAWPVLCGVKSAYIEHTDPIFIENCRLYYRNLQIVEDVLAAARQDQICKLSIYDAIDTEKNSFPFIQSYANGKHIVTSGKHWVDLTNPNVTKGGAVQFLKSCKGLDASAFMAFGDYMNDMELLQECEESYAMANAHPMILRLAKHQTFSNQEDGVVRAICAYFSIDEHSLS